MDKVNGISFEDYALAAANMATGMSEEEVCEILGVEPTIWAATLDQWSAKMAELMAEDMSIATKYGEYFQNPKQGKFANVGSGAETVEEVLKKVPDLDRYQEIFWHQSKAAEAGMDVVEVLEEYDLNLQSWSAIGQHYSAIQHEMMNENHDKETLQQNYKALDSARQKWEQHWEAHFAKH